MSSKYAAYRKRRLGSLQDEIVELREICASRLKKIQELEEQNYRLSESLKERMIGYVPRKPKKEKQTSQAKKDIIHAILMKRGST